MNPLSIPESNRRWDCVSFGEVMLRLDPGGVTLQTAESFIKTGARSGRGQQSRESCSHRQRHPETITETARVYLKAIAEARKN